MRTVTRPRTIAAFALIALVILGIAAVADVPGWVAYGIPAALAACTLLGHRPTPAAFAAIGAGAIAVYVLLKVDEPNRRPLAGLLAIACAVAYARPSRRWLQAVRRVLTTLLRRGAQRGRGLGGWLRATWAALRRARPDHYGTFLGLVASSVLAVAGAVVGTALVLGALAAGGSEPTPLGWLYVGLAALCLLVFLLVFWWTRSFMRIVLERNRPGSRLGVVLGIVVVAVALAQLERRELPNEPSGTPRAQVRADALGRFDVMLVVDAGDRMGRRLVETVRRQLRTGSLDGLLPRPADAPLDVAFGVAERRPGSGSAPRWRVLESPTTDVARVLASIGALTPRAGRSAAPPLRQLADDLHRGVRWRDGAQRGVVLMLGGLPSRAAIERARGSDGAPTGAHPVGAWRRRDVAQRVALHVVTREPRPQRLAPWRGWTASLGGRVLRRSRDASGPAGVRALLENAQDLQTGVPVGPLARVVRTFRPHLRFDAQENYPPTDVDWLLYPSRRRSAATGAQEAAVAAQRPTPTEVCDRVALGPDNCEPLAVPSDLAGALDEHIDLRSRRPRPDELRRPGEPSRMYVHARAVGGRLYLGYWWFFRYNTSPWRTEVNCLPGLTFSGVTCHDHAGDWEGVTVVLRRLGVRRALDPDALANLAPEAVVYEAHGRPIRWSWRDVQLAADPGHYATHPVVYVAVGSHASYPTGCAPAECTQRLSLRPIGEGGFDGAVEWVYNDDRRCRGGDADQRTLGSCLVALPTTPDARRGVLWNAFPGAWGKARCTVVGRACSLIDGPASPALQTRFKRPAHSTAGPGDVLRRFAAAFAARYPGRARSDAPAWPPPRWPVRANAPLPRDTALPR